MKLPGIFVLTRGEQRAVIVIMTALLAAAIVKRYHDHRTHFVPTTPAPIESSATPSQQSADEDASERDE